MGGDFLLVGSYLKKESKTQLYLVEQSGKQERGKGTQLGNTNRKKGRRNDQITQKERR